MLLIRLVPIAAAASALLAPTTGLTQSTGPSSAAQLAPVTVTAPAQRPELATNDIRNPFRTPASSDNHVQVITREEIEQLRPVDVFDLLNHASGVVATQGSRKGFSGLLIRGDSNFRWIIDGALLQPTMASRMLKSLPVMAIEAIEIVRGGSALTLGPLVGSASPGGAPVDGFVIIRTRKPLRDEAQLRVAAESFDTVATSAWAGKTLGGGDERGYVAGLLSYNDTNGPSERLDNGASYNLHRQATGGLLKGGFTAAGWLVDLMLYYDDGSFGIPNSNSHGPGQASWYMDPARTSLFSLTGSKAWSPTQITHWSLSHTESRQKFWTANTAAGPYSAVQNDNKVTHFNLRHVMELGSTRVTLGGDSLHWDTPTGQQYYEGIRREEKTTGWFGMVEQSLWDERLNLDASVRRDRVHVLHGLDYYIGGAQPPGGVNSPLIYTDRTLPAAHFYSVGASWKLNPTWRLLGRYGQARQGAQGGINPAAGVVFDDDVQKKWEFGAEGRLSKAFNPTVNFFSREVTNEKSIVGYSYTASNGTQQNCRPGPIPGSGPLSLGTNQTPLPCYGQADTTRAGVELVASGQVGERSGYRVSLTHFTKLSAAAAPITPRNIVDVSVSHGWGAYTFSGAIKAVSAYRGATTDAQPWLGDYTRLDAGLGRDLQLGGTPARITVYGRNLTDKKYETTNGVQDPGRTLGIELLARF